MKKNNKHSANRSMIETEERKSLRLQDLNDEIERGLQQLACGEKIPAKDVFEAFPIKHIINQTLS